MHLFGVRIDQHVCKNKKLSLKNSAVPSAEKLKRSQEKKHNWSIKRGGGKKTHLVLHENPACFFKDTLKLISVFKLMKNYNVK